MLFRSARQYNELNFARLRPDPVRERAATRGPAVELVAASFESTSGEKLVAVAQGEPCCVRMDVHFHEDVLNPIFSAGVFDELGHVAFVAHSNVTHGPTGPFRAGQEATIRIRFENWLGPGRYHLTASIIRDGPGADIYEKVEDVSSVIVHATKAGGGVVDLPHSFEIEAT